MNDFYKLAFSLGAPVVIEPEWSKSRKLIDEGKKLYSKGEKLLDEGWKLREEGWKLYEGVVDKYFGLKNVWINWDTGEVIKYVKEIHDL